jgi:alpha-amylase
MTEQRSPSICLYFQVHQPYRLRDIRYTDIGNDALSIFDEQRNRAIFRKVAEKCYLPCNALLLTLLQRHPDFHCSFSISGSFIDQCKEYGPDVLESFQALAQTGRVEFLAETYTHSLCSIHSVPEFCAQVDRHVRTITALFGKKPTVFRNTELIYSNELAHIVRLMGFRGMLAEGTDNLLHGRSPTNLYVPPRFRLPTSVERDIAKHRPMSKRSDRFHVLLKQYRLSDDIAFRFSQSSRSDKPLTAEQFSDWCAACGGHSVNLFMDYETFGEHQWADTGIFQFLEALPKIWEERGMHARTPSQVIDAWGDRPTEVYDVHSIISWADSERNLSAWEGNPLQDAAIAMLFELEQAVKASQSDALLELWRRLQTSDHFYYMCTKYWSDGDVHKYFSPYSSPYEAFRRYSHALRDLQAKLARSSVRDAHEKVRSKTNVRR